MQKDMIQMRQIANMTKYKRTKTQMLQHTKRQKNMTNYNQVPLRQRKNKNVTNTKRQIANMTKYKKTKKQMLQHTKRQNRNMT